MTAEIDAAAVRLIAGRTESQASDRRRLQQQRRQLVDREATLTESFIDATLSPQAYDTLAAALRQERTDVEAQLNGSLMTGDRLIARVRELLRAATDVWDLFGRLGGGLIA